MNNILIEKNQLIKECAEMDTNFIVPYDYKELKLTRKILLPNFEDVNFVQMLMGTKG